MKVASKYFLYLTVISLLEIIVVFLAEKPYDAYSIIVFLLLTIVSLGLRSRYCFYKVTTYIKHNAPAFYNKYTARIWRFKVFFPYLISDPKAINYLDDERRNLLMEYKLLQGYLFVSFLLVIGFSLIIVLK